MAMTDFASHYRWRRLASPRSRQNTAVCPRRAVLCQELRATRNSLYGVGSSQLVRPLLPCCGRVKPWLSGIQTQLLSWACISQPDVPEMAMASRAVSLSEELGLRDRTVHFNMEWVPYDRRQDFLLEASLGVSMHFEHVETAQPNWIWITSGRVFRSWPPRETSLPAGFESSVPAVSSWDRAVDYGCHHQAPLDDAALTETCRAGMSRAAVASSRPKYPVPLVDTAPDP